MPNWIRNTVRVTENVEEFKKVFLNKKGEVDFEKLFPMPKELLISSGSDDYEKHTGTQVCSYPEGSMGYQNYMICLNIENTLEFLYNDEKSQEEFAQQVVEETADNPYFDWHNVKVNDRLAESVLIKAKGYWNLQKYGYINWYDWSVEKWGTKWNACDTVLSETENGLYVEFQTAWDTPDNIWQELMNRGFKFDVVFADEDFGSNLGILSVTEGNYTFENIGDSDLPLNERQFISYLIFYGIESEIGEDEEEFYHFSEISQERQEELIEWIKPYLM